MATIKETKEIQTFTDEDGNVKETVKETTQKIERTSEPDFIKLYTNVWCEFNQIPLTWRPLFLELVAKMTYCDSKDLKASQIVFTGSVYADSIMEHLNIGRRQYQKGLRVLVECGAIRKIQNKRGVYQINPNYAGRGEWKYNPKYARGGIEDLKAEFDFVNGTVITNIVWANDGSDSELNTAYREALSIDKDDNTTLKTIERKPITSEELLEGVS